MPSTSTVPAPTTSAGSGTNSAITSPISGRSISQRRLTVDWLTPKIAPVKAWVTFVRITHTTSATEPNRPSAYGRCREANPPPLPAHTRLANSVSCSLLSPVIALCRNGSLLFFLSSNYEDDSGGEWDVLASIFPAHCKENAFEVCNLTVQP